MTPTTVTIAVTPLFSTGPVLGGSMAVSAQASPPAGTPMLLATMLTSAAPTQAASVPTAVTTATVLPTPLEPSTAAAGPSIVVAWVGFAGVLLAAAVVATWNVWLARRRSREEERSRQRTAFAEAYKAYGRYRELPYAIRRRNADEPAEERARLSEVARDIQAELTYHQTWMDLESSEVAAAYRALITELRKVAGGHMREAWMRPAITTDTEMNMVIDMGSLTAFETEYLDSVRQHLLCLAPWWCR
jgi:hypothetical protein